jgi:GTP-binding protein
VGDSSINTLLHLKYNSTMYVERGSHGKGKGQRGGNGEDTYIKVPLGTVVWTMHKGGEKDFLTDVTDEIPRLVAQGGAGGWGNAHYVSPTNQEPLLSQRGERGDYVVLFLELKLLADVGLLARPNAGKSTLISRCSAAKPRIADFPFTTVEPVLGVVNTRGQDFVMMEVPGLLEGAHEGVGLGDQFLRHAERARLYVHVLDGLSEDPVADFHMINRELQEFNPALAYKPQIIAVNKIDVTEVQERRPELAESLRQAAVESPVLPNGADTQVFFISAVSGEGIEPMLGRVIEMMENVVRAEEQASLEGERGQGRGTGELGRRSKGGYGSFGARPSSSGCRAHHLLQRPGRVRYPVRAAGATQRPGRHPRLPGPAAVVAGNDPPGNCPSPGGCRDRARRHDPHRPRGNGMVLASGNCCLRKCW